ncbi:hypothetical protein IQ274_28850 [Nostoc sp. LEGE 12447]|uniref:hypothetical protein n=1 Tax=Nostoc sp. LEGE 12447 TaxID=1828640 RepID=UPI00188388EB|nr:hypothetical protein [Nostoc sp. LEGE 12447]MBE9002104.1 hypothetical protein [Nostoc sp. LEGE 12447]
MLFYLSHSKKSSIASYIQLFYQGSKQFRKSKSSNHEDVIGILSSNTSQPVYLPNVLNKTALAAELDNCQSKEINKKSLTTKSRFYWWM